MRGKEKLNSPKSIRCSEPVKCAVPFDKKGIALFFILFFVILALLSYLTPSF